MSLRMQQRESWQLFHCPSVISESRSLYFLLQIMEELKKRIAELEEELKVEKSKNATLQQNVRQKISEMSSEVVDSNPYR